MSKFAKLMFAVAGISGFCCGIFILANSFYKNEFLFAMAITFGTVFYHFTMRLTVGNLVDKAMAKPFNYDITWFKQKKFEQKFYKKLKLHKYKGNIPTYQPEKFDLNEHTPEEIIHNMCTAEVCHEVIIICSFFPIAVVPIFGEFWVFLITSLIAAGIDLVFVMLQRYNRPRAIRVLRQKESRAQK